MLSRNVSSFRSTLRNVPHERRSLFFLHRDGRSSFDREGVGRGGRRKGGGNSVSGQCWLPSLSAPRYDSLRENRYVNTAISCTSRYLTLFLLIPLCAEHAQAQPTEYCLILSPLRNPQCSGSNISLASLYLTFHMVCTKVHAVFTVAQHTMFRLPLANTINTSSDCEWRRRPQIYRLATKIWKHQFWITDKGWYSRFSKIITLLRQQSLCCEMLHKTGNVRMYKRNAEARCVNIVAVEKQYVLHILSVCL